jgi:hypothetical protein
MRSDEIPFDYLNVSLSLLKVGFGEIHQLRSRLLREHSDCIELLSFAKSLKNFFMSV